MRNSVWMSQGANRRAHWNCPNQAKNRPSGRLERLVVAFQTSRPTENRERAAITWVGLRSIHSKAKRAAVILDVPFLTPGAKENGVPNKDCLLSRHSPVSANAISWLGVR